MLKNRFIILLSAMLMACSSIQAQKYYRYDQKKPDKSYRPYKSDNRYDNRDSRYDSRSNGNNDARNFYVRLGFGNADLEPENSTDLRNYAGASLSFGRNFYFGGYRRGSSFMAGIDATFLDLNYSNYKIKHVGYQVSEKYTLDLMEYSAAIGPCLTWMPFYDFTLHGYFQYCPTYATCSNGKNDLSYGNYASLFKGGLSASYSFVGIGCEYRFGNVTYRPTGSVDASDWNASLSELRIFLSLTF